MRETNERKNRENAYCSIAWHALHESVVWCVLKKFVLEYEFAASAAACLKPIVANALTVVNYRIRARRSGKHE